jgi:hypothetical protein
MGALFVNDNHVCIMLLTYKRTDYALKTLESALKNIKHEGPLSVHIADDGSPPEHRKGLVNLAEQYVDLVTVTDSERRGYGANYNLGTQVVHSRADVVLPLEDDWELLRPLDTSCYLPALRVFGCIRMGYIGFTQELRGTLHYIDHAIWMRLYEHSREPHVFAGHPRLESVAWERNVGPWPELLEPGATEFEVARKDAARLGVAWPLEYIKPSGDLWAHIGTIRSY